MTTRKTVKKKTDAAVVARSRAAGRKRDDAGGGNGASSGRKGGTGKTAQTDSAGDPERFRQEIWSVIFLALATVMFLALLTYRPADPGLAGSGKPAANWIGRSGAWLALVLLQGFGYSAYLVNLAVAALGVLLGMRRSVAIKIRGALGFFLVAVSCSLLFDLLISAEGMAYNPGGLTGSLLGRLLVPYVGKVGLGILGFIVLFLALVLATRLPPLATGMAVGKQSGRGLFWILARLFTGIRVVFRSLGSGLKRLWLWRANRGRIRRERREAEALEARLVEEARQETERSQAPPVIAAAKGTDAEAPENVENSPPESGVSPETAEEKPSFLDRGQKEITIHVRRSEDMEGAEPESETADAVNPDSEFMETPADERPETETSAVAREEAPESAFSETTEECSEPQIVDRRPRPGTEDLVESVEVEEPQREYRLPPISLLDNASDDVAEVDREQLYANARLLEQTLLDYKIEGKVTEIHPGPVVTMYEFAPARGTKISRIANLEDDLAMALAALKVRIVAPIPGKSVVGIEVPSAERETVYFKEIVGHKKFAQAKGKLTFAIGKDIFGHAVVTDLQKMPHLLIAGATGAGKSVGVNTMILSLLFRCTPDEVRFILIDPKRLEFNFYDGIPHLLLPVVTDPQQASLALAWVVREMDNRYKLLSEWGVKNIDSYNKLVRRLEEASVRRGGDLEKVIEEFSAAEGGDTRHIATKLKGGPVPGRMPFIVVVIDELADLMMVAGKDVEISIARLAQLARASGIHLIVATQRPSTDVLTGLIKNNFPARMSFRVSQKVDSRTILDRNGAEALLGRGDMLYRSGGGDLRRTHGAFVTEEETARIVTFIKKQRRAVFREDILARIEEEQQAEAARAENEEYDSEYDKAVAVVCDSGKASISMLQRKLRVGYNRAARMIEKMEEDGLVGPSDGVKGRPVYGRPIPK